MLTLSGIKKAYADRVLFADATLQVNREDRIGLVGPNGAGKTTLFSIILGEESADEGETSSERGVRMGYLPQENAPVGDETVIELATQITPEFTKLRRILKAWEAEHPTEALHPEDVHDDVHDRFNELGGYRLEAKAKQILAGLSFREKDFERPAREMSGGWVMRAHLGRLLTEEPDLLLLDEPTNHLDLEALLWFQDYLKSYPGAILVISHDREFLNQLVGSIVEIRQSRLIRYRGNYDDYLVQREANEQQLEAAFKHQEREIGRLMEFVNRFRAKNTKASQAQSKLKQIERMEKVEAPSADDKKIDFEFPQPQRSGQKAITLKNVHFAYPSRGGRVHTPGEGTGPTTGAAGKPLETVQGTHAAPVTQLKQGVNEMGSGGPGSNEAPPQFGNAAAGLRHSRAPVEATAPSGKTERGVEVYRGIDFLAERGQRIVLVGPNGAGKSTLLKILAEVLTPQQGERILGHNVKAGYYSQYRVDMLKPERTVLEEGLDTPQRVTEQSVRTLLGCFLFRGDDVFKKVEVLSGGEKSRLALVKLLLDPPNLLLMDEPTTHLDMSSIDALAYALDQFQGTLIFISHDVYFIRALANHVVHVNAGRLTHYPGGYQYYLDKTKALSARAALTAGSGGVSDGERGGGRARARGGLNETEHGARNTSPPALSRKDQKRAEAEQRQARSKDRKAQQQRVHELEKAIQQLEQQQKDLVLELEKPETYEKAGRAHQINRELMDVQHRLGELNPEWEEAAMKLENVDRDA